MPKKVFWPLTLVVMGLIFLASNMRLLPSSFWNLWPVILIVVGLGGLVTSDQDDWQPRSHAPKAMAKPASKSAAKPAKAAAKKVVAKKRKK